VRTPDDFGPSDPAAPAQKHERRLGAAAAEHSRELDRIVHSDPAEFRVRHCPGVRAQAKDRGILTSERTGECGAVHEVLMKNLAQFWMRDARRFAADCGRIANRRII
jgi:hypothetical protein